MTALTHFLQQYGWFIGPPLALLIVIARVYRPAARARWRRDSRLPFDG